MILSPVSRYPARNWSDIRFGRVARVVGVSEFFAVCQEGDRIETGPIAEVQEVVESWTAASTPPLADGSRPPSEEPVHGLGITVRSALIVRAIRTRNASIMQKVPPEAAKRKREAVFSDIHRCQGSSDGGIVGPRFSEKSVPHQAHLPTTENCASAGYSFPHPEHVVSKGVPWVGHLSMTDNCQRRGS